MQSGPHFEWWVKLSILSWQMDEPLLDLKGQTEKSIEVSLRLFPGQSYGAFINGPLPKRMLHIWMALFDPA